MKLCCSVCTGVNRCVARMVFMMLFVILSGGNLSLHASEPEIKTLAEKWASAISNDRTDQLQRMLNTRLNEQGDPLELLRKDAPNGKSALMVAAKQGELALVQRIVGFGVNINEVTLTGGTPFMFAVLGDHISVASWLHEQGADINAKGSNGWSAATIAGAKGQTAMAQWLIEAGANINAPDVYQFTPLMRAVDNQHADTAQVLLELGGADVDFADESGNTALHFAVANNQLDVVNLLLNSGADPQHKNRDGITPADLAVQHPKMANLFQQKK